jgi:HPt (histidine-containing phosphotransfer) domain-containing protein
MLADSDVLSDYRSILGAEFGPFAVDLVDSYLRDVPGMLGKLQEALGARDQELYIRIAHTLKSNSRIFGADRLAEIATEIEEHGIQNGTSVNMSILRELEQEYELVRLALLTFREQLLQES